jgi:hypothetical protein
MTIHFANSKEDELYNVRHKSRIMGEYQARFRDRLGLNGEALMERSGINALAYSMPQRYGAF